MILGAAMLVASAAVAADDIGGRAPESGCNAFAVCQDGSMVTCSGSGTCTGVDAACPLRTGYVVCDGVTTSCPACRTVQLCKLEGQPCLDNADCRDGRIVCASCWCVSPPEAIGICICP
jgi:hypothetical protein